MSAPGTPGGKNFTRAPAAKAQAAQDRRKHQRTTMILPAHIVTSSGDQVDCTVLDASARGARVAVSAPLPEGEAVTLKAPDFGVTVARVVWAEPDCLGLEFLGRNKAGTESPAAPRILVAEDEESMRELLRRMLDRAGFTVTAARDGREALKLFNERPADVTITDLLMPEMDGFDFIRALITRWPNSRIIALSGATVRLEMARQLGVNAVVRKPVSSTILMQTVEQVLAGNG